MTTMTRALLITTLFALGCGTPGEGEGEGEGERLTADAFLGIYELSSFRVNEAGCDAPGDETIDQQAETFFFLDTQSVLGQRLADAFSCASVEDCRDKRAAYLDRSPFGASFHFAFDRGDDAGLTGQTRTTGFSSAGGTCTDGGFIDMSLTPGEADEVVIETRARLVDYPADADGFCTTDGAEAAAANAPCGELETVSATRVAPLEG